MRNHFLQTSLGALLGLNAFRIPILHDPASTRVARIVNLDDRPLTELADPKVSSEKRLSEEQRSDYQRLLEEDTGGALRVDFAEAVPAWLFDALDSLNRLIVAAPLLADRGSYPLAEAIRAQAVRSRKRRLLAPFHVRKRRARNQTRPCHHR